MIETLNNIIFYIGYALIVSVMMLFIVWAIYNCVQGIFSIPVVFRKTINKMQDNSFKKCTDEEFEEWVLRMRKRYKKISTKRVQ